MKIFVFVGSGHGHLEIIKGLSSNLIRSHRMILISPTRITYYSGLVPRFLARELSETEIKIESAQLAEKRGFKFIQASVSKIESDSQKLYLSNGDTIEYDFLSVNVGGVLSFPHPTRGPLLTGEPERAGDQVFPTRPIESMIQTWDQKKPKQGSRSVVIGAGPAAIEIACALRLLRYEVTLVISTTRVCQSYHENISRALELDLADLGIHLLRKTRANKILENFVLTEHGEKINFDFAFLATGTVPNLIPTLKNAKVNPSLRGAQNIFIIGDAAEFPPEQMIPRSGVSAIRQGRHLLAQIPAILSGDEPKDLSLPKRQLNILIVGHKRARLIWGRWHFAGRLAYIIKDWLDQKYMRSFRTGDPHACS